MPRRNSSQERTASRNVRPAVIAVCVVGFLLVGGFSVVAGDAIPFVSIGVGPAGQVRVLDGPDDLGPHEALTELATRAHIDDVLASLTNLEDELDERLEDLADEIDERFEALESDIDALAETTQARLDALDAEITSLESVISDILSRLDALDDAVAGIPELADDVDDLKTDVSSLQGSISDLQNQIADLWNKVDEIDERTRHTWTGEWSIAMQDASHLMEWEGTLSLTEDEEGIVLGILTYRCVQDADGNPVQDPSEYTDWIKATVVDNTVEGIFRESCSCGFDDYWANPEDCHCPRLPGTVEFEMSSDGSAFEGFLRWGGRLIYIDGVRSP